MKDCFQQSGIVSASKRHHNGIFGDLGSRAVRRPLESVHKTARDSLEPVWRVACRQAARIVVLNPKPKRGGPVIRGSTIGRLLPCLHWIYALWLGPLPRRGARPVPCSLQVRAVGEPSLVRAVVGAMLVRGGITHPSILSHRAVVGAPTVACTLLLDVVVAAEGCALCSWTSSRARHPSLGLSGLPSCRGCPSLFRSASEKVGRQAGRQAKAACFSSCPCPGASRRACLSHLYETLCYPSLQV